MKKKMAEMKALEELAKKKEQEEKGGWFSFSFFWAPFLLGFFPKKMGAQECSTRELEVKA